MGAAWVAASAPVLVLLLGSTWRRAAVMTAAALIAGVLMSRSDRPAMPAVAHLLGQEVVVYGTVLSEPDPGTVSTTYDVRADRVEVGAEVIAGAGIVRATLGQYAEFLPGDKIRLEGELRAAPVFDGFDYRSYLERKGVYATMLYPETVLEGEGGWTARRWLTSLRLTLDESLQRALPEPSASLAAGIAFGRDGGLSISQQEAFNRSGLRHLVAVSGSNITMVAAFTLAIGVRTIGRRWSWVPAGLTIALYLLLAGASASVLRAGFMAGVYLVGEAVGRPQGGLPALAAACIAMTAWSPSIAAEPGFQLSVAATAGLLTIAPWLRYLALRAGDAAGALAPPGWLVEVGALSVAASVATAPVMWFHFGELSAAGPLANVVVQPVLFVAFWASVLTALLGAVALDAGWAVGLAAYYPLAFIVEVADFAGGLKQSVLPLGDAGAAWAAFVTAVVAAGAAVAYRYVPPAMAHRHRSPAQMTNRLVLAGAGGAAALAVVPISILPIGGEGELRVDFLDIGQGDATLITTPGGHQVLVDGGPSGIALARQLGEVMPHWDRRLEFVIATHPQEDHIGGLPAAGRRFGVDDVADAGVANTTLTYEVFEARFPRRTRLAQGDSIAVDGVTLSVLWPPPSIGTGEINDTSLVMLAKYGDISILLTGDIEAGPQRALIEGGTPDVDVLKVPHHGAATNADGFLDAVSPAVAVISAGESNRFGHPAPGTVEALANARLYRTDLDGRVTIRTDGQTLRVSTTR